MIIRRQIQMPNCILPLDLHIHRPGLKKTFPLFLLVITPFFAALPASSPMLFLKQDLFFNPTSLFEILTLLLPSVVSDAIPVFGYGTGTPGGVAGFSGGVKQTSGMAQIVFPAAALHDISRPFAKTLLLTKRPLQIRKPSP